MNIPYVNFPAQYQAHRDEILSAVDKVLASGQYIGGDELVRFEESFAAYCGVKHAVAVANGTDALILALRTLGIGPGDEVITAPNSWVSSASTIALVGATPVFVDVGHDQNMDPDLLEQAITSKTKAIIPVHLTGKMAKIDRIVDIAKKHRLNIIEDSAQAVGAMFEGKKSGTFGDINCFSLHPLKNLSACGDAGIITTNDTDLFEHVQLLRQHGMSDRNTVKFWGYNSRLDNLQAAILNVRMKYLDQVLNQRRENAFRYIEHLDGIVELPKEEEGYHDVFHLFVIQCDRRDELKTFLEEHQVMTAIHYPTPIHLQPAAQYLGYKMGDFPCVEKQASRILSLPVSEMHGPEEIDEVSRLIRQFYS